MGVEARGRDERVAAGEEHDAEAGAAARRDVEGAQRVANAVENAVDEAVAEPRAQVGDVALGDDKA